MKKPKLPRKRKKAMINVQGRKSYLDTIKLAKITGESPCKFWKNNSIAPSLFGKAPALLPIATQYW